MRGHAGQLAAKDSKAIIAPIVCLMIIAGIALIIFGFLATYHGFTQHDHGPRCLCPTTVPCCPTFIITPFAIITIITGAGSLGIGMIMLQLAGERQTKQIK